MPSNQNPVYTDSTLTGDGTVEDPLHAVGGGGGTPGGADGDAQFNDGAGGFTNAAGISAGSLLSVDPATGDITISDGSSTITLNKSGNLLNFLAGPNIQIRFDISTIGEFIEVGFQNDGAVILIGSSGLACKLGFFGNTGVLKQTVTGAKADPVAASILAALVAYGMVTDGTT